MNLRWVIPLCVACAVAGCAGSKTQRSPTLTAVSANQTPPQRNAFEQAGDTTWQVVTAPARFVAPKKANPKQPEVFDPPAAVIVRRSYSDDDAPATQPVPAPPAQSRP